MTAIRFLIRFWAGLGRAAGMSIIELVRSFG